MGDLMLISKMTINDYLDVYNLWIATKGMGLNNIDDSKEGIEKYLKRNPNTCFVARENDELIGVIISGHDGRRGFIYHTSVKESERNKGIGKRLVETALNALKEEGISKVALVVFKNNEIGNLFWEKIGFEQRNDLIYRNLTISDTEMIKINT
jgi:ribosomal protein S18 acetylase RimI-like enzyme